MFRSLRTGVLLAFAATLALGFDFSILKPQGPVSDFAHVLDARARASLIRYCDAVEDATGAQIALVTIDSLHGEPIEDVANLLYREWGVGDKDTNEGVLLLLAIEDRQSRLEVGYGLEPYIPDGYAGELLRGMRDDLRAGDYAGALAVAARTLGTRVAAAKGVDLQVDPPRSRTPVRNREIPWAPVAGFALLLFFLLAAGGRVHLGGPFGLLRGLMFANVLGGFRSGFHGRSSGGFGGYDSSDSFGGFGGGDSGGGGASSNW